MLINDYLTTDKFVLRLSVEACEQHGHCSQPWQEYRAVSGEDVRAWHRTGITP
jgi:hypothetical protein